MSPRASCLILALSIVAGCGSSSAPERQRTDVSIASYDTSCSTAADCTPISVGQFCPCAPCPNAAINAKELASYQTDVKKIHCQVSGNCGACPSPPAVDCVDGGCVTK